MSTVTNLVTLFMPFQTGVNEGVNLVFKSFAYKAHAGDSISSIGNMLVLRLSKCGGALMAQRLTTQERMVHLGGLEGWQLVEGRDAIARRFVFSDFNEAFGFMSQVALYAEQKGHHPEWTNVYNRVDVTLSTHDAAGLSKLDIDMARFMNGLVPPPPQHV